MVLQLDTERAQHIRVQKAMKALAKVLTQMERETPGGVLAFADLIAVTTYPLVRAACGDPADRAKVVYFLRVLLEAIEAGGDVAAVSKAMRRIGIIRVNEALGGDFDMPLKSGRSRAIVAENIREMTRAGYARKQAVAAALHNAGKPQKQPRKAIRVKALVKPKGPR